MTKKWFDAQLQYYRGEHCPPKINGTEVFVLKAGPLPPERIVPPAGEEHAFDRERWEWDIEVYRSPKGRSIRVFVNGDEVPVSQRRK